MKICKMAQYLQNTVKQRDADLKMSNDEREAYLKERYHLTGSVTKHTCRDIMREVERLAYSVEDKVIRKNSFTSVDLARLSDHLYLQQRVLHADNKKCLVVLESLRACFSSDKVYPANTWTIEKIFDAAVDVYLIDKNPWPKVDDMETSVERQAEAAIRLEKYILEEWTVEEGKLCLSEKNADHLHLMVEKWIENIGGAAMLQELYRMTIAPYYDKTIDHYLLTRHKRGVGRLKLPPPAVPINYLLQTALKHLSDDAKGSSISRTVDRILTVSSDVTTILGLSDLEQLSDISISVYDLPEYIENNARYENMCLPVLYSPDFCLALIERLYLQIARDENAVLPVKAFKRFAQWVLQQPPLSSYSFELIRQKTNISSQRLHMVLDICAWDAAEINRDFNSFSGHSDGQTRPLLRLPNGEYFQVFPHYAGYAFCESLHRYLKPQIQAFDRKLGRRLEKVAEDMLSKKKMCFVAGHYRDMEGKDRECDLVLEGKDEILFLEIKKRPLPDSFGQGDVTEIFRALSEGMVYGQMQAIRHRMMLERNGSLTLYKDAAYASKGEVICGKGKRIYTVALCLPEYAFLANAVVAQHIIMALNGRVSSDDVEGTRRLEKFNMHAEQFRMLTGDVGPERFETIPKNV